jgi:hypothetical protein
MFCEDSVMQWYPGVDNHFVGALVDFSGSRTPRRKVRHLLASRVGHSSRRVRPRLGWRTVSLGCPEKKVNCAHLLHQFGFFALKGSEL